MRRAILAIVVLAVYGCVSWLRVPAPRAPIDEDMPRAPALAAIEAPRTIDELRARIANVLDHEHSPVRRSRSSVAMARSTSAASVCATARATRR